MWIGVALWGRNVFMLHQALICLSCNNLSASLLGTISPPHNTRSQLSVGSWMSGGGLIGGITFKSMEGASGGNKTRAEQQEMNNYK